MKPLYTFIAGLVFAGLFSFTHLQTAYDARKSTAEVEQYQGIYIFTDCKPVLEYEYIGKVTAFWIAKTDYETVRDEITRQVKKKQKDANAVILHFSEGSYTGDAIKIKEPAKE